MYKAQLDVLRAGLFVFCKIYGHNHAHLFSFATLIAYNYLEAHKMIPFSPPRMDGRIVEEVTAALTSGWITTGPRTKKFEAMLSTYGGHKATLCVSSASAGLELVLRWFGVKQGDEVILPAYTYAATANVIVHCGAKPVFVDVNDDFNISVEAVRQAITARTKVIMPVDIGGWPANYKDLNQLVIEPQIKSQFNAETQEQAQLNRILVLSDAAHSIGATIEDKTAGAFTDITVYSFHAVKNLTTAEGGAICLNMPEPFDNLEIYKTLNIKSLHGQNKDALAKTQIGNWRYDIVEAGYKCNMTDIQAAMGIVELERYTEDMLQKRKQIFDEYAAAFSRHTWAKVPLYENDTQKSSYHVFLLRINAITEAQRDKMIAAIFAQNVSVNVHFVPLPMMTFYKSLGYTIKDYPMAYKNYACEISLPVYYDLSQEQVQWVIQAVEQAWMEVNGQ
jgi:dTDP-4-amino-4,6-dideoxygalactose transaminase